LTAFTDLYPSRLRAGGQLRRWWPEAFAVTIVGLPFLAAIVRTFRGTTRLGGDHAVTELAVRAVGTHAVLVGPYSRFGWRHPGPLFFYALAPFYWLFGAGGRAITAGAILIGLAAAGAILVFARRRGGPALMLWTALVVALLIWHIDEAAWSTWTPYVTILPAAAFLVAAWSVACRDRWALPVVALVGSFVVQTHVAYLPVIVGVGLVALVVCVTTLIRRRASLRPWRLPGAIAVGLTVLVWIPPAVDVVRHDPNNLSRLIDFREDPRAFENEAWGRERSSRAASSTETHTVDEGWRAATRGLGGFLDGRAERFDDDVSGRGASWASLVAVAAVVGAGALAVRRRRREVVALIGLLVVAFAASVYAASDVVGPLFAYLVTWTSILSVMAWIAVGAAVVPELERVRVTTPVAAGAIAVAGVAALALAWPGRAPIGPAGSTLEDVRPLDALISRVERQLPEGRPVVVRTVDLYQWPTTAALVAGLRDDGFDVYAERQVGTNTIAFEPRDLRNVQAGDTTVTVAPERSQCGDSDVRVLGLPTPFRLPAEVGPGG
jgi:hypothetical protein